MLHLPVVALSGSAANRPPLPFPLEEVRPAAMSEWGSFTPPPPPGDGAALLLLLAGAVALAIGLAGFALGWLRRRAPLPATGPSAEEMRKLRAAVTAFASLLHDGSAALIRTNAGTIDAANRLAARSEDILRLIAQTEARLENATERSEILATRVARSAAQEIKSAVESLKDITAEMVVIAAAPGENGDGHAAIGVQALSGRRHASTLC